MKRAVAVVVLMVVSACGPLELRIDETRGVPGLAGSVTVSVPTSFVCSTPIISGEYTVATRVVGDGCEFSFDKAVELLKASDYQSLPELQGVSNLVQRVELTVKKLRFVDGAGVALDLATRVTSATLQINGQQVADKTTLTRLPQVVSLSGASLTALKEKIDARQPATVQAKVQVVLPNTPRPPESLTIEYDAQPAIILGPGKIF